MASGKDHGRVRPTTTSDDDVAQHAAIQLIPGHADLD